jgi:hypothetical protein
MSDIEQERKGEENFFNKIISLLSLSAVDVLNEKLREL